jgi:DNA-binding response OmpR family regulator
MSASATPVPARIALSVGSDLMFGSRLAAAAARAGLTVEQVGSLDAAVRRLASNDVGLVIVDLSSSALDPADAVQRLRAARDDVPILAFGPHVHEGRLAAARAAGASEVLSRGAFDAHIDDVLRRYLLPAID